jgi:starch synthase
MLSGKLKIAHVSSEVDPFSRSGGLASVAASLPKAHRELGHAVIVITPFYQKLINPEQHRLELVFGDEPIFLGEQLVGRAALWRGYLAENLPIYFIANQEFFGHQAGQYLYGAPKENLQFLFFDLAVLTFLKKLDWRPDILHCHDWHSGLIPYFLKERFRRDEFWHQTATVFTIHNLVYQLGHNWWEIHNGDRDDGRSGLPPLEDGKRMERLNFAKRAILNADVINTVSETYREEILTKDFGEDLHRILKNREQIVFGIVNGIDYNEYNPLTDPGLPHHYSEKSSQRKKANKESLQARFNLKVSPETPLLCMTSRIAEQKGFELLLEIAEQIMRWPAQLLIMGNGDSEITKKITRVANRYPERLVVVPFDKQYETAVYAGADMFLLPSRFEPCGINQMIAMRYGCIPIVHHIGGLADTVVNFNPVTGKGNGFTFNRYQALDFWTAITRALETYKYQSVWQRLVLISMGEANSWKIPAKKYIDLYRVGLKLHAEHHAPVD